MNDGEQVSSVNWKWFCILAGTMVMVGWQPISFAQPNFQNKN